MGDMSRACWDLTPTLSPQLDASVSPSAPYPYSGDLALNTVRLE